MSTHNMFSDEIVQLRHFIRDYGGYGRYINAPGHSPTSYKQQAALELAARLEAEDRIKSLEGLLMVVDNVLDCEYKSDEWGMVQLDSLSRARSQV